MTPYFKALFSCVLLVLFATSLSALSINQAPFSAFGQPNPDALAQNVVSLQIHGVIGQATLDYVKAGIDEAKRTQASALLLVIDTPGGALEPTRLSVAALIQSGLPFYVFIGPEGARAGSAGVFFTLAAHQVGMSPATHLGAAHPVTSQGEDIKGDMGEKIENDTVAWAKSLAQLRSRPSDLAEKFVRESISLTATEAFQAGVADALANTEQDFLEQILKPSQADLPAAQTDAPRKPQIIPFEMTFAQKAVHAISDPNIIYVLLLAGLAGLFIEFKMPGLILPGAFGALSLAIVFGLQTLPLNLFGVLLIFAGIIFLILEIYVASAGLLAIAGISVLISGSYLLFDRPDQLVGIQVARPLIWIVGSLFVAGFLFTGSLIAKAQLGSRKRLQRANTSQIRGATPAPDLGDGDEEFHIGDVIQAISTSSAGKIFYRGTYWTAELENTGPAATTDPNTTKGTFQCIAEKSKVKILGWRGLTAVVTPYQDEHEHGKPNFVHFSSQHLL